MDFLKVVTIIGMIILAIHSVSSFDCSSPTGQVTCECTDTSIECTGILKNVSEIEKVLSLANFSLREIVVIKMFDLKFGPDFAFVNTSIRNLTLGYGLETLPSYFFQGSSSLVSLNLEKNRFQDIDDQLFSSLPALEELVLDGNDLFNLTPSIFMNLPKLKRLSVADNHLREIDADLLQYLSALEILTLNRNNISSIGNLRMKSTSVVELNVARCSMKGALEKDSFSGLPNLERLDLSHNELSEVKPHSLSTLKNLEHLDLSHNSIHRLEGYAFSEMRNLTTLDLKHNGISVLKETCFENLKKLVYLDLSSNNMTAVLCDYTTHFDSLEKIYLQNNRIKTFTQGAFFYSPYLQVLNITGNNFECSCSLTDTALYLIENSTLSREDLKSISCVIKSNQPTISSITDYKSSNCSMPLEQCKRPDEHKGSSNEDGYGDYSDEIINEHDTNISPMMTELTTQIITSIMHTINSNIISTSSITASSIERTTPTNESIYNATYTVLTTEPSTAGTTESTKDTTATSIPPRELVTVDAQKGSSDEDGYDLNETTININDTTISHMKTELTTPITTSIMHTINSNIISASSTTASSIESIPPTNDSVYNPSYTVLTTEPSTAGTTESTKDTTATSIPPTEHGTVEAQKGSSDEDGYDLNETTTNINDTTISHMKTELTTPITTSIMHTINSDIISALSTTASSIESTTPTNDSLSNTTSEIFLTIEPSTASMTESTKYTAATSIPPTELVTIESTSLTVPNTSTIKTTSTILITMTSSVTESTMPMNDDLSNTSDIFITTESTSASIMQSTQNTAATRIPSTELVIVENTSLLIPSTSTIKTTPNVLKTNVSIRSTTVTGILPSNTTGGDSCSLLDLSVEKFPLDSKFMVFRNFSYDGSTFCLKWTIVGDLNNVKKCIIRYTFKERSTARRVKCPLINEIINWRSKKEINEICLVIYAPKKRKFCNSTWYGRTTALLSETMPLTYILQESTTNIVTETMPFKVTERVNLTEDTMDNQTDYFTTSISVHSHNSNTTSDIFLTTKPSIASTTQSTKDTDATSIPHTEPAIVESTSLSILNTSTIKTTSHILITMTSSITESTKPMNDGLSNRTSDILTKRIYISLICLLILLILIVAIIIFKNMKKQESQKYNVHDEENKYDQRVKV